MRRTSLLFIALTLGAGSAFAQAPGLTQPEASPAASVEQTVGVTAMKVTYHRPAVNKRKVWGELVPYGDTWRAGANENTLVSFSTPVKVERQGARRRGVRAAHDPHRQGVDGRVQQDDQPPGAASATTPRRTRCASR